MFKFAFVLVILVTGCMTEAPKPIHVVLGAEVDATRAEATRAAVFVINERAGVDVLVVGEPEDRFYIGVGILPNESSDIGFARAAPYGCQVDLRGDADDWTTPAHEMFHCFGAGHVSDPTNIMFGDYAPEALDIDDDLLGRISRKIDRMP